METTVTGCKDCPLVAEIGSGHYCQHPIHKDTNGLYSFIHQDYESEDNVLVTPEWCPLNSEPITISKTK